MAANGYRVIGFQRRLYLAAHLAWFFVHGRLPDRVVDHINRDRADDRIDNLRLATHGQNHANEGLRKNNTSGFKGVCVGGRKRDRWMAYIHPNRRFQFLGYFDTPEEAARAYDAAAAQHFGDHAQLNFP